MKSKCLKNRWIFAHPLGLGDYAPFAKVNSINLEIDLTECLKIKSIVVIADRL